MHDGEEINFRGAFNSINVYGKDYIDPMHKKSTEIWTKTNSTSSFVKRRILYQNITVKIDVNVKLPTVIVEDFCYLKFVKIK